MKKLLGFLVVLLVSFPLIVGNLVILADEAVEPGLFLYEDIETEEQQEGFGEPLLDEEDTFSALSEESSVSEEGNETSPLDEENSLEGFEISETDEGAASNEETASTQEESESDLPEPISEPGNEPAEDCSGEENGEIQEEAADPENPGTVDPQSEDLGADAEENGSSEAAEEPQTDIPEETTDTENVESLSPISGDPAFSEEVEPRGTSEEPTIVTEEIEEITTEMIPEEPTEDTDPEEEETEEAEEQIEILDAEAATGFADGGVYVLGISTDEGLYAVTNNEGTIVATLIDSADDATGAMTWTAEAGSKGAGLVNNGVYLYYSDTVLTTRTNAASNWKYSNGKLSYDGPKGTKYYAGAVTNGTFACVTSSSAAATISLYIYDDSNAGGEIGGGTGGGGGTSSIVYNELDTTQGIATAFIEIVDPATGTTLKLDQGSFQTATNTVQGEVGSRTATTAKGTYIQVTLVEDGYTLQMQDPPGTWNYIYVQDGVLKADDKDNPGEATSFNNWYLDGAGHLYYANNGAIYYLSYNGSVSSSYDGVSVLFGGDTSSSGGSGGGGGGSTSEIVSTVEAGPQITEQPKATKYMIEGSGYAAPVYSISAALPEGSAATSISYTWYVNGEEQPVWNVTASAGVPVTSTLRADTLAGKTYGVYPVYCVVSCTVSAAGEDGTVTETVYSNTSLTVNFIVCKGINNNSFLTFSDVHETFSHIGNAINNIMSADGDGLIPALIICTGDWANGHYMEGDATSDNYATTRNTYITRLLGQSGGIDTVFVAGNHDNSTAATDANIDAGLGAASDYNGAGVIFDSAVANEKDGSSAEMEGLIVYGINYENIKTDSGYSYANVLPDLESFLEDLRENYAGQLIVISAHAGLHKLEDWGGNNDYNVDQSDKMVELLNRYALTGMNIMFFFGHDHSKGESEMLVTPGGTLTSTVSYADLTTADNTIYFTYGHAGYITSNVGGKRRYVEIEWTDLGQPGAEIKRSMSTMDTNGAATLEESLTGTDIAVTDYQIIEGEDGKWEGDPSTGLSMRANGSNEIFKGVLVDGKAVDVQYYTAAKGSTVVTLKPEYLRTLENGTHTMVIQFNNGETDEAEFTVQNAEYLITEADGSVWEEEQADELIISTNGVYNKFLDIVIDDQTLDIESYSVDEVHMAITLKPEYLKTLAEGEHTIVVRFTDGQTDQATFTIRKSQEPEEEPTTPDEEPTTPDEPEWIQYLITAGDCSVWDENQDNNGLAFTANGDPGKFSGVYVDNQLLDAAYYSVDKDSMTITLKPEYLKTLLSGEHRIFICFTDGETDSVVFKITTSQKPPLTPGDEVNRDGKPAGPGRGETPETGDVNNSFVWIFAVAISLVAICFAVGKLTGSRRR